MGNEKTNPSEFITKADLKEEFQNFRLEINKGMQTHVDRIFEKFDSHVGTLYEKFSDDVKLIAERSQETNRRLGSLEEKVDVLDQKADKLENKMFVIEQKLDDVIEIAGETKTDLTETNEDVVDLKTRVALLEAKK